MVIRNNSISKPTSNKSKKAEKQRINIHKLLQKIGEDFESELSKSHQTNLTTRRRPSLDLDPSGYDVYIGIPKPPYYDDACEWVLILHSRSQGICQWFYTFDAEADNPEAEGEVWKRQYYYWPCENFKCEEMTTKRVVGGLSTAQRHKFLELYASAEVQGSEGFVKEDLDACVATGLLAGEDVVGALGELKTVQENAED